MGKGARFARRAYHDRAEIVGSAKDPQCMTNRGSVGTARKGAPLPTLQIRHSSSASSTRVPQL
jgi:hypothetical protein